MGDSENSWQKTSQVEFQARKRDLSLQVRHAEFEVQRHEARMMHSCRDEASQLSWHDEAHAEAWWLKAREQTREWLVHETSLLQKHFTMEEERLAQYARKAEQAREASFEVQHTGARKEEREAAWQQRIAVIEARMEQSAAGQLDERRRQEEQSEQASGALELEWERQQLEQLRLTEDAHWQNCERAVASGLGAMIQNTVAREYEFAQCIASAELSFDEAQRSAADIAYRQDYQSELASAQLDSLLATSAGFEKEHILAAAQRREALLHRHRTEILAPALPSVVCTSRRTCQESNHSRSAESATREVALSLRDSTSRAFTTGVHEQTPRIQTSVKAGSLSEIIGDDTRSTSASGAESALGSSVVHSTSPWNTTLVQTETWMDPDGPTSRSTFSNVSSRSVPCGFDEIPVVYQTAIAAVQRFGWDDIHGRSAEWTALHWAAAEGREDIVSMLLRASADPCQPDHVGRSAIEYARDAGHQCVLQALTGTCPVANVLCAEQ